MIIHPFILILGSGYAIIFVPAPAVAVGKVSCMIALVGGFYKALSLCNTKAAACGLLCVLLVHFGVVFLKGGSIEAV